ncbi:unnamed protein product [Cylindrotheca closterium]|uniref:Uncharacterized protein n=1 Tax=Cylindrotheca closterium TaxID=2856 RepID=A0AAD2FKA1_9STRA|nr:unnamed protein product [Cylindrotheca closterium]
MSQSNMMKLYLLLSLAPLIVHGFAPPQSQSIIRTRASIPRKNQIQVLRRPRQGNSIPSSSILQAAADDPSSVPPPPKAAPPNTSSGGTTAGPTNVDVLQQAEQAREQIQVQLKEAENRRIQLEKEIQSNAATGKQNLESNLRQSEKEIQELQQLQKLAKDKFNIGNIQFPTLETLAESVKQVPTRTWLGTAVGASVGGLALGRINLQKRRKLKEEQEYEQRLAEAETARNQKIAQANSNRDRFLAAGSTLVVGTAVTALAQFSQKDSVPANNNKRVEQSTVNNNDKRPDASSALPSNGPSPDLPYLEQRIQKAEDQVKNSQQALRNDANRRKELQLQMAQEESFKRDLTQQLEQTEQSIRQANLAKERFEMESQLNARKAAADISAIQSPQSSPSEKVAAQEQAKKEVQMAEAQRLAAFAETQRIGEMERKLDEEVKARMELLQKLQSTEASLKQANDRAQLAALEAQMAKETKEQALAESKATTEKALAEKQMLEQQAAAEKQKAQLAALETQKIIESNERAMAEVLAAEQMAAEAKAEVEEKARIAMHQLQQAKSKQPGANTFMSSIKDSSLNSIPEFVDTKGLSNMLQQGADAFQAKRDETSLVTRAAVDELLAITKANTNVNFNAFRSSPIGKSLATSFGDENVPTVVAAILGSGVAATGLIASGIQNSKKNGPNAAAQTEESNALQPYNPTSPPATSGQNSFFTSKEPRTDVTGRTSFLNKKDAAPNQPSFFTSKEPRTDMTKSKQTNFFTNKDSYKKTPPGFLSALGGMSSKGKGPQMASAGKDNLKDGKSSKSFTAASPRGTPNFGSATAGVVPISTTTSAPSAPNFGARNGLSAPSFGSPKGVSSMPPGGFKGSSSGFANGQKASSFASNSPSFTAPKTSTSFGGSNGSTAPNGPASPEPGLSSKRGMAKGPSSNFGAPKGSTASAASPATMESKGQDNVAGFGDRNGVSVGTLNSSPKGLRAASSPSSDSVGASKGFSPYGSKGASQANASSTKGSTQSSFNPSNSPFGNSNTASSAGVGSSSTKVLSSSKGFSPSSSSSGTTQSNQSFNPSNSPFGKSNVASSVGDGSSRITDPSSAKGSSTPGTPSFGAAQANQSHSPSNSPFGNHSKVASSAGVTSSTTAPPLANGFSTRKTSSGTAQSNNPSNSPFRNSNGVSKPSESSTMESNKSSFNPSNSPFGNSNVASSGGIGSSSTTVAPFANDFSTNNPSSGTAQSIQSNNASNSPFRSSKGVSKPSERSNMESNKSSFNPSNSPFGNSNAASSSSSTATPLSPMGGYSPSNPSSGAAESNSFNHSAPPFGNSNGATATTSNGGSSKRAERAPKGYGVASASKGYDPNKPSAGTPQSSQSSLNPSNSPFGNNIGAPTTGGAISGKGGPGLSAGYNPSNPSFDSAQSTRVPQGSSIPPTGVPNQGMNQRATNAVAGRWEPSPSSGPNLASIAQASSPNPDSRLSDTSGDEQEWRESKPNQGDWWNVEKRDYFTTLGRRETKSFQGRNLYPNTSNTGASSYSPFGNSNQQSRTQSSIQPYSPPPNQGTSMDTNQEEQLWRQTASPGSQWFETERIDHYTDRGVRVTRSFTPNGVTTSPLSSYSPFGQQNSQTTAPIAPASGTSSGITPQDRNSNNSYNSYQERRRNPTLDASQSEQQWRESSATPGGQWFEQEKLDFYTSRGTRATRSFNGGGTREDVNPNNNANGNSWQ